ncbi:DUF6520 family protein [Flavivirga amylovorans]|uniref:DUF6520 family protein n=1 Tax=Flavivirga amylovorans TaxID=870486 RepID=A0ABT8X6G4_9FLAO|nr:DUF6520 family protein [Flavivirga amylovorans]MDO5989537.1 DUF6520 family protein [Flavivirga amylovorans]
MKSNFFKIVLPAFALMLAITASLAFTPANDADVTLEQGFIQTLDQQGTITACDESIICDAEENAQVCTVGLGTPIQVFGKQTLSQTSCSKVLYRVQ